MKRSSRLLFMIGVTTMVVGTPAMAQVGKFVGIDGDPVAMKLLEVRRLEVAGTPARAYDALAPLIAASPGDFRVLVYAERLLNALDRRTELIPLITRALTVDSTSLGILAVAVRTYAGRSLSDSARKYAERWAKQVPGQPTPYREWAEAATTASDLPGAILALRYGQSVLPKPSALSAELAQAYQQLGDYTQATQEWLLALKDFPTYRSGAVLLLGQSPPAQQATVSSELTRAGTPDANRLQGLLLVKWGKVIEGTAMVRTTLPTQHPEALAVLQELLDLLRPGTDRATVIARATVLEQMAVHEQGVNVVARRIEAMRAYADAGQERDARRLLDMVSGDRTAPKGVTSAASGTMIALMISEGHAETAETTLKAIREGVSDEERQQLTQRLALLFAKQRAFDHAEALVREDSTVSGIDVTGRIRLFRGDLKGAAEALRYAGPFDDRRSQSVSRLSILAILQAISLDSSRAVGEAFLALEARDSVRALALFDSLATTFPPAGGAESRFLAGQIAAGRGETKRALALFTAADLPEFPGTAAAARFARAKVLARSGERDAARTLIESLIIDFPDSAVLSDARHLRDELRGAVPGRIP